MLEKQDIPSEETQESKPHTPYNPESIKKIQQEEQDSLTQEDPDSILDKISEVEAVNNKQITEKTIEVRKKVIEYCKNNKTFQDTGTCTITMSKGSFTLQK